MKKLISTLFLCVLATPALASYNDWQWQIGTATFGVSDSSSDGFDANDQMVTANPYWYVATYKQYGDSGWTGSSGFYSTDMRSPVPLVLGQSKSWQFYFWADQNCPYTFMEFQWGYDNHTPAAEITYRLTYERAAVGGDSGSTPVGTSFILNSVPQGTWRLPVYKTSDGTNGYVFQLTATVVPEPSSLLALSLSLLPLGLALARKRG